jgi:hypothetical protein
MTTNTSRRADRAAQRKPQTRKPQGQVTRGKTAQNRLRRVDLFFARYDPALLRRSDGPFAGALFVDLGYGAEPLTTLETAARLRAINPSLRVLGVEIDRERVLAAQPYADEHTEFRLGGFNLPLALEAVGRLETVRAIRAFNVLRQYAETDVVPAYGALAQGVLPGGLLVEGTSDPYGRIWAANVLRRAAAPDWEQEALVFSTNFRSGFDPAQFQAVLPKSSIHRMTPGEPIHALLEAWKEAARRTLPERAWGLRRWFSASAAALAATGVDVVLHSRWPALGYLIVRHHA